MIAVSNPRLVAGSGRRYMDKIPEVGLVRPVTGLVEHPYGSLTAETSNSELAGIARPIRTSPLPVRSLYAVLRADFVETSSLGHVAPSNRRNSGSVPSLRAKRACADAALIVHPVSG